MISTPDSFPPVELNSEVLKKWQGAVDAYFKFPW